MMKRIALPLKKTLHFLTYSCVLSSLFFASNHLNAQVGINNTDPKASLDISASNPSSPTNTDGLLVPRVSDFPGTAPTVDQNGMLLYLTTTVGLNTPGFYYWNQPTSSWLKVTDSSVNSSDADFYEEGTTTAPDDITDDIFTQGRMAVGRTTISNNNAVIQAAKTGLSFMQITSEDNGVSGINLERVGAGQEFTLFSTGIAGLDVLSFTRSNSAFNGWTNDFYLDENGEFTIAAVSSELNNKVGIGVSMVGFSEANKVTIRGYGNTSATSALKLKNSADTDLLNVKDNGLITIGTTTTGYTLPSSRGTNTQIMQTDGSGNISWIDASTLGDHDFYESGTTTAPNDINDNIYHSGDLSIGVDVVGPRLTIQDFGNTGDAGVVINRTTSTASTYALEINSDSNVGGGGIYNDVGGNVTSTFNQYGLYNDLENVSGSGRSGIGVYNNLTSNASIFLNGVYNNIGGTSNNTKVGVQNYWLNNANGNLIGLSNTFNATSTNSKYGIYSVFGQSNDGTLTGAFHEFRSTTSSTKYGVQNRFIKFNSGSPAPDGTMYGVYNIFDSSITGTYSKYGVYNNIPSTTAGVNYGTYNNVLASNSYAGYFLGNVSIGTTTANNYILPSSRGTNNQIMQTDASGNVSWVDIPNSSYWSRSGTELDVTTTGDDIHFTSDQTSITFAQSSGTPSSMIYMFDGGSSNVDRMVLSHSSAYPAWGLEYEDVTDSFIFKSATAEKVEIDLNGGFPLRVYGTARAEDFQSDTTIYPDYVFENYFKGYSEINSEYYFKTLSEIETFIKQKGYLPGVKSYEEIKEKGMVINLAETSITNLEKIEELFLYAIEMKKENEALKEKQKSVEERLLKIEQYLKNN